jgi:hypothetical protein
MNTKLSAQTRHKRFGKGPGLRKLFIGLERLANALALGDIRSAPIRRLIPIEVLPDVEFAPVIVLRDPEPGVLRAPETFSRLELSLPGDRSRQARRLHARLH